jgi:hypothetical protein
MANLHNTSVPFISVDVVPFLPIPALEAESLPRIRVWEGQAAKRDASMPIASARGHSAQQMPRVAPRMASRLYLRAGARMSRLASGDLATRGRPLFAPELFAEAQTSDKLRF